ncbi:MAG TPA: M55 family metallopeptidase [Thermomicrobiales bacterium]|nr:M55 family metallopeptidase [Thermomicrobiales bacterium]
MVKVFVTTDIEGVAGVVHTEEGSRGNPEYERARRLMTAEASAVVAGIFDADPEAEVTVADCHGPYRNIIPEELDERAILSRGKPRHFGMMDGIEEGYDLAMFVGVHGSAGAGPAVLSHTFTGVILDVKVNGTSYGELGLNAAMAGAYDVPVILVSGDQQVESDVRETLGDDVVMVPVKKSRAHLAAESVHPAVSRRMLREAAAKAMRDRPPVSPLQVGTPVDVEVSFARPVFADLVGMLDDVERVDGRTIRFQRADMPNAYRILRLVTVLCSTPV